MRVAFVDMLMTPALSMTNVADYQALRFVENAVILNYCSLEVAEEGKY